MVKNIAILKSGTALGGNAWGQASDRRGTGYADLAKKFLVSFPLGSKIHPDQLDAWLHQHGMLVQPPANSSKNSDVWLSHLQRRHIMRGRINKAASHPRMASEGSAAFSVVAIRGGFEVLASHMAVSKVELPHKLKTLAVTKRQQLAYLMQSADWSVLPPHEQAIGEEIYNDIDAFVEDTGTRADRISAKLARLERRISVMLASGAIVPLNGGFTQILAAPEAESAAVEDELV